MAQAARRAAAETAARAAAQAAPRRRYPHRVQMAGPLGAAATAGGAGANSGGGFVGAAAPSSSNRDRDTYGSGGAADGEDSLGLDPELPCPPEVASLLRLLMGDDFRALTAALQVHRSGGGCVGSWMNMEKVAEGRA